MTETYWTNACFRRLLNYEQLTPMFLFHGPSGERSSSLDDSDPKDSERGKLRSAALFALWLFSEKSKIRCIG